MKRTYILPLLAMLGLCLAIAAVIYGNRPAGEKTQGIPVFQPPFDAYVAGVPFAAGSIYEGPSDDFQVIHH